MATTNDDDLDPVHEDESGDAGETLKPAKRGRGRPPKSLSSAKVDKGNVGSIKSPAAGKKVKSAAPKSAEPKKFGKKDDSPAQPTVPSRNSRASGGLPTVADSLAAAGPSAAPQKKLPEAFLRQQKQKLLDLRDHMVSQMQGVARDTLRGSTEGSDSAFGMHQADAGSDSYDRDFALNLLSKEQDALYEIDEALMRLVKGTYGICEESGEIIPQARLEAMPFARLTVACQEKRDQEHSYTDRRQPVTSLFGLEDKDKTVSDED